MMEMFTGKGKDTWQNWWQNQNKIFDLWKESMSFQNGKIFELPGIMDWFSPERFYQNWLKMMAESFKEYLKWIPDIVSKESFEQTMQKADGCWKPFTFWSSMAEKLPVKEDVEKWKGFCQSLVQNYDKMLDSYSLNFPEPVKLMLKSSVEMAGSFQQFLFNFFQPWLDYSPELRENFFRFIKGDHKACIDFLRIWYQAYQESYGKFLQIPALGLSRESFEKLASSIDSYMRYMTVYSEFFSTLYKIGYEALENLIKKTAEMAGEGKAPTTFKDFYQLWWQTNESAYLELFKTDSFAKMLGEVVDAGVEFKKNFDELLVEFFSMLPVPTKKDMDSLYKSVYQLRKALKDQVRKTEELSEMLEQLNRKEGTSES